MDADERPEPDDIASHAFFRAGYVPDALPMTARIAPPPVTVWNPKMGGTVEDWWQVQWAKVCQQCGVGRKENAQCFPLVGRGLRKSTYKECQLEERAGRTPVIPMPNNTVYKPFPESNNWPTMELNEAEEDRDLLEIGRIKTLKDDVPGILPHPSVPDVFQSKTIAKENKIDMMSYNVKEQIQTPLSPRYHERKSHAAKLREQAQPVKISTSIRTRTVSKTKEEPKKLDNVDLLTSQMQSARFLREQAVRPAVKDVTPAVSSTIRSVGRVTRSQSVQGGLEQPSKAMTMSRAGILKSASSRAILRETPAASNGASCYSSKTTRVTTKEINSVGAKEADRRRNGVDSKAADKPIPQATKTEALPDPLSNPSSTITLPHSIQPPTSLHPVAIDPHQESHTLPNTSRSDIHRQLGTLIKNLDASLAGKGRLTGKRIDNHPGISRWVDYSDRFGFGYVLNDGSAGCIFNVQPNSAPHCVVVRDAEEHVRRRKLKSYEYRGQLFPSSAPPVEFVENHGEAGFKRVMFEAEKCRIKLDGNGVPARTGPGSCEIEDRQQSNVVLWRKFANYMLDAYNEEDATHLPPIRSVNSGSKASGGPFLKFYQRFAQVGVWAFDDGVFQVRLLFSTFPRKAEPRLTKTM